MKMAERNRFGRKVERVLDRKRTKTGVQYLIRWLGQGKKKPLWEPLTNLQSAMELVTEYRKLHPGRAHRKADSVKPTSSNATKQVTTTELKARNTATTTRKVVGTKPVNNNQRKKVNEIIKKAHGVTSCKKQKNKVDGSIGGLSTKGKGPLVVALTGTNVHTKQILNVTVGHSKRNVVSSNVASHSKAVEVQPTSLIGSKGAAKNSATSRAVKNDVTANMVNKSKGRVNVKSGPHLSKNTGSSGPTAKGVSTRTRVAPLNKPNSRFGKVESKLDSWKTRQPPINRSCMTNCAPVRKSSSKAKEQASSSESDDVLYSLADGSSTSSEEDEDVKPATNRLHPRSRKRLKLNATANNSSGVSDSNANKCTTLEESDSEIVFKASPRKMLLMDSIKSKAKTASIVNQGVRGQSSVCAFPAPVIPQLPSSRPPLPFKTPPNSPTQHLRDPSPSRASTTQDMARVPPLLPILPNSPAGPSYETLKKNMASNFPQNRGVKRKANDSNSDDEVERRVSVRHSESAFKYKEIIVKKCQGFTQIWLHSQTRMKNSFNPSVFQEILQALHNAKFDDSRVVLLTGSGSFFSSGVDLDFLSNGDRRLTAKLMSDAIKEFVNALIMFPKPVVAAVNGPAIGLGVTILPLCDIVYASDKASFYCPYTRLCQTPVGGASYTFPHVMGNAMAGELLLAGRRITAMEAHQCGLVSQVFWPTSFMQEVVPRVRRLGENSAKAMEASKLLLRSHHQAKLQLANHTECQMVVDRWASSECQRAIRCYLDKEHDILL